MSEQINIDGVKFKIGYDSAAVEKGLKDDEKKASEAGKKVGSNFSNAFQAVVGAGAMVGLKAFFSRAESEFNRLEGAMKRVESIAKGFGRNIELAKKNVNELADEGFLNLTQAASGYADAIALGFDEKQARKFIGALSDIAAYQNTIGNGAEAVTSGLAGLLSNSAEKVENIGVPVKILNQEYNKNIATMGKAAALQKFYNGILKESEKFQGDAARSTQTLAGAQAGYNAAVEKSFQAIGKGLEPTLKRLYQIGTDLAMGFANWFSGLDALTKTVILAIPAIATLVGAIIPLVALISPMALAIAGAVVALTALTAAAVEFQQKSKPENVAKGYKEAAQALTTIAERAKELETAQKRTAEQEKELISIKEKLSAKAKQLGVDYADLTKKTSSLADQAERLQNIEREQAANKLRERLTNIEFARKNIIGNAADSDVVLNRATGNLTAGQFRADLAAEESATIKALADIYQPVKTTTAGNKPQAAANAGGKRGPEFRFIEARDQLRELEKEYRAYIRRVGSESPLGQQATEKLAIEQRKISGGLRESIAEYIEDRYTAEKIALDRQQDEQIANVRQLVNKKEIGEKEAENKIQAIREANARKTAQIGAEAFARTMQGANAIASGFAGALRAQNIGQALGGFGGIAQGIGGLSERFESFGVIGQGIAAAGGIISTLTDLFGKSDAERQREAEKQRQRDEEARALLELQANYQKSMLALQEAAAKLPFENLTRNLRLVDIQAQQATLAGGDKNAIETQRLAQRQALMQGVLTEQAGTISGGALFAGTGSTPEAITQFLSERAAQAPFISEFVRLMQNMLSYAQTWKLMEWIKLVENLKGKIPDELYSAAVPFLNGLKQRGGTPDNNPYFTGYSDYQYITSNAGALALAPNDVTGEITRDTGTAESLLSVIQDSLSNQIAIEENTRKTAENTAKALTLRPDRERSFIDVGRGYIQSLGQRLTNPALAAVAGMDRNIVLPGSIGMASGVATAARTLQERLTDAAEMNVRQNAEMIDILYDARTVLVNMLAALDSDTSTINRLSVAEFDRIQSEVNRRRR